MAVLCSALLLVSGCDFIKRHKKAVIGAGVGALAGAAVGGAYKGRRGAIVGGLLGALAGGAIGAYLDHRDRTAAQTYQQHQYQPTQGVRIEVIGVDANPSTVAPGSQVTLLATYAVMAPDPQQQIQITETRLVTFNGQLVANPANTVIRTPGTYTSQVPVTLPAGAPAGQYELTVTVAGAGQQGQLTSNFAVQ